MRGFGYFSLALLGFSAGAAWAGGAQPMAFLQIGQKQIPFATYPAEAKQKHQEGVVAFHVELEPDGKLRSCSVTKSSGFKTLDYATCGMLVEHGSFGVTRDAGGAKVMTVGDGIVTWLLDGKAPALVALDDTVGFKLNEGEGTIVCKRQTRTGAFSVQTKVCLSKADWERQEKYARDDLIKQQMPQGPMLHQ